MKFHASQLTSRTCRRLFQGFRRYLVGATVLGCLWIGMQCPAHATPYPLPSVSVAADGAVSTNGEWEAGRSSRWFVELQRYAAPYIDAGVHREDPALIAQGLHILQWAFDKQAPDGTFPTTSDAFHSTTFFTEAAARALLQLKDYKPVTYTLAPGFYDDAITAGTKHVHDAALWLASPAAQKKGLPGNLPFAHRRWMLAAALAEAGQLSGDTALGEAALPFAEDGLAMQLSSGWRAALSAPVGGVTAPAVLVSPGSGLPAGTVKVLDGEGINPERGGYDVSYQAVGVLMAERYYPLCTDSKMQAQIKIHIGKALHWEKQWVSPTGFFSYTGSTRMGLEFDRSGRIKLPDLGTVRAAFTSGADITGDGLYTLSATRMAQTGSTVSRTPISLAGAAGTNADYDSGKSHTYAIARQTVGAAWVDAGTEQENEVMIKQGLNCFNWGFLRQKSDGSFPNSDSYIWGAVMFLEAAARATLQLKAYHPQSYSLNTAYYDPTIARYKRKIEAIALFLAGNPASLQKSAHSSPSRLWTIASAFAQAAQATGDSTLADAATSYGAQALALQSASGVFCEDGVADVNAQAISTLQAARYCATLPAGAVQTAVSVALKSALDWESDRVSVDGTVTGTESPAVGTINAAFSLAALLLSDVQFQVNSNRLDS